MFKKATKKINIESITKASNIHSLSNGNNKFQFAENSKDKSFDYFG